jgi:hypothetical protein
VDEMRVDRTDRLIYCARDEHDIPVECVYLHWSACGGHAVVAHGVPIAPSETGVADLTGPRISHSAHDCGPTDASFRHLDEIANCPRGQLNIIVKPEQEIRL